VTNLIHRNQQIGGGRGTKGAIRALVRENYAVSSTQNKLRAADLCLRGVILNGAE
jgi:hypothetical protein